MSHFREAAELFERCKRDLKGSYGVIEVEGRGVIVSVALQDRRIVKTALWDEIDSSRINVVSAMVLHCFSKLADQPMGSG